MTINNRIFKAILVLVIVLMVLGYSLVFYLRLDKPLFFYHYYDQRVIINESRYQDVNFILNYITNVRDEKVVTGIEFPEYPEIKIRVSAFDSNNPFNWSSKKHKALGDIYGQYSVRRVNCMLTELPNTEKIDGIVLTQAKIKFSDESVITANIGEIHFYPEMPIEIPMEAFSSTGSSDGTGETSFKILKDLTLTTIDDTFMEKFKDRIQWQINDKSPEDSIGETFKKDHLFEVTSRVTPTDDIITRYTLFDAHPELTFVEDNGLQYSQRLYNLDSLYHHYSFMELYRYIKAREAN